MARKGRVKIDWNSRAVMNAFETVTEKVEHETAKRTMQKVLKYTPVLNRKQRKWGHYFRVKHDRGKKNWQQKIPGALRRSIRLYRSRFYRGGWTVFAGDYVAWYAWIVERGTTERLHRKTGRFVGKMPAKKYMRKAITSEKRIFMYHLKKRLGI